MVTLWLALTACWWGPVAPTLLVLSPPSPAPGDAVTCAPAGPGARLTNVSLRWTVDGEPAGAGPALATPPRAGQRVVCAADGAPTLRAEAVVRAPRPVPGNLLLLVADDLGVDKVGAYGARDLKTPTLDALAAEGVRFTRAYADAICSPTRATLLTARYARRTGVGTGVMTHLPGVDLALTEQTLPELLGSAGYASAALGKWHLASSTSNPAHHPLDQGFQHFRGTPGNLSDHQGAAHRDATYFDWDGVIDGEVKPQHGYITSHTVDDALALAAELPEPWLLYVAFHAPHTPLHEPPPSLLASPVQPGKVGLYDAMVEAMDAEIGRLLRDLDPELRARTHVVVVGDNGTPSHATRPPLDPERAKGTLFEGGVHVPLIIAGPAVATPGVSEALVNTVDIPATLLELAGVRAPAPRDDGRPVVLDGLSLVPQLVDPAAPGQRGYAYVERFSPNGCRGARCAQDGVGLIGPRFKLLRGRTGQQALYDLRGHVIEGPDLLAAGPLSDEAGAALAAMSAELDRLQAALTADVTF